MRRWVSSASLGVEQECAHCRTLLPAAARFCFMCGTALEGAEAAMGAAVNSNSEASALGKRLARALDGRYLVGEALGAGGMGVVYAADDLTLERRVAVKVLRPNTANDAGVVQRFHREAKTAAKLDHPHIIPIYRVESEAGLHFIVMRYVAGRSLESMLAEHARLPLPFVLRVLTEAAIALGHAHQRGVVHRDVKPANIMLDTDDRVVLTDFGISKSSANTPATPLTQVGTIMGTPHYMAPEQALSHVVDGRADQYALAVVGFEMLTGQIPFDDETPHAIIHRHINEAPPRLPPLRPDVPPHVTTAIARALSKSPSHRFPSMEEFAAALNGVEQSHVTAYTHPALMPGQSAAKVITGDARTRMLPANQLDEHAPNRRSRRLAFWGALAFWVVLGTAGATGWIGSRGGSAQAEPSEQETPTTASKPATGTRRTSATKAPGARAAGGTAPARTSNASTTRRPAATLTPSTSDKRKEVAMLNVTSKPQARILIDGKRIGETPLSGHPLTVGRTYQIRIERKGYLTKRDSIAVKSTRTLARNYVLKAEDRR